MARFAWDNGLWYPYEIRVGGRGLWLSVGDFEGTAQAAVEIDPRTGEATTMAIAGFVGPGYLS